VEHSDNLNGCLGRQLENGIGKVGKGPTAEPLKLAASGGPELAYIWKAEHALEGVAEVIKKTARHCGAVVGLVVKGVRVHVGFCPWEDNKSFRHGGGVGWLF